MEEVIADWWACKYFPSSAGLPSDANAKAFPEYYERGTKAKAIFDIVNPV